MFYFSEKEYAVDEISDYNDWMFVDACTTPFYIQRYITTEVLVQLADLTGKEWEFSEPFGPTRTCDSRVQNIMPSREYIIYPLYILNQQLKVQH